MKNILEDIGNELSNLCLLNASFLFIPLFKLQLCIIFETSTARFQKLLNSSQILLINLNVGLHIDCTLNGSVDITQQNIYQSSELYFISYFLASSFFQILTLKTLESPNLFPVGIIHSFISTLHMNISMAFHFPESVSLCLLHYSL